MFKNSIVIAGGLRNNKVEIFNQAGKVVRLPNLPLGVDTCSLFMQDESVMVVGGYEVGEDKRTMCYQLSRGIWKPHSLTNCERSQTSAVTTAKGE